MMAAQHQPQYSTQQRDQVRLDTNQHPSPYTDTHSSPHSIFQERLERLHRESQRYRQLQEQEEYRNLSSLLRREQFGREGGGRDHGDSAGAPQTPRSRTFSNPTPSQRTHERLDRLAEEASNVVKEIVKDRFDEIRSSEIELISKRTRSDSEFSLKGFSDGPSQMQSLGTVHENAQANLAGDNSTSMSAVQNARNMPRSSSVDSATSSSSSNHGHLHSSSPGLQAPAASPVEIAQLIQAAGSAEAVIAYLLKDKSHIQAQNTQLWRLVDKQRAMVLGLGRDLERALKDKEKYRQKLKEHIAMFPGSSGSNSRNTTDSPAPSEHTDAHSPQDVANTETSSLSRNNSMPLPNRERAAERERNGSLDVSIAPHPSAPYQNVSSPLELPNQNPKETIPSPTPHFNSMPKQSAQLGLERIDPSQHLRIQEVEYNQPSMSPLRSPLRSPRGPELRLDVDSASNPVPNAHPSSLPLRPITPPEKSHANQFRKTDISESEARPSTGKSERSTPRKGPPARLELERPTMPFEAKRGSPDHDESNHDDDDDDISVEEIAGYEERMKERDIMSYEEKSSNEQKQEMGDHDQKVSESRSEPKAIIPENVHPTELVAPGSIDSIISPVNCSTKHQPSGTRPAPLRLDKAKESEACGLKPPSGYQETIVERKLTAPYLMSPGLPNSPRPAPNSPLPRPRRDISSPEPLSPRSMPRSPRPGLPASPRVGLTPGTFPHQVQGLGTPMKGTFTSGLGVLPLASPNPFSTDRSPSRTGLNSNSSSQTVELLVEPSAISAIEVRVVSSRMKPSRASFLPGRPRTETQDSVFTLGIFSQGTGKEQWRVEKDVGALPALDSRLRQYNKDLAAELPDRSLFTGHAPARVDARRTAIDAYFNTIMNSSLDEQSAHALCEFFSADVLDGTVTISQMISGSEGRQSPNESPVSKGSKEGYLTKRGKNFGGWKSRYFVLDGPVLRYYEAPGGEHLGSIKLQNAQIGRQSESKSHSSSSSPTDLLAEEHQYRHAFLIMEPKRKDSNNLVRHVLCAENDAERDEWVEALMQWVDKAGEESSQKSLKETGKRKKRKDKDHNDRLDEDLRAFSYEDATPGIAPARGPSPEELRHRTPTPTNSHASTLAPPYSSSAPLPSPLSDRGQSISKQISGPVGGAVISDATAWGNKTDKEVKALKKRSIWGFRGRTPSELESTQKTENQRAPLSRMVFGVSLEEAIAISRSLGIATALPSVVYRCLEYLDAKNTIHEEGIFRLNGSNLVIKALRDRFNSETDVNLLASDEYYDVHAVAGLLKLYLRELPTNILTSERREDFLRVTEIDDRAKKIAELNRLVHGLPAENFVLLKALSGHLIRIVENSDINRMTVKNVGIVFSPTLNIPAQVFSLFLQEYHSIFVEKSPEGGNEHEYEHDRSTHENSHAQLSVSYTAYNHSRSDTQPTHSKDLKDSSHSDQPRYQTQAQEQHGEPHHRTHERYEGGHDHRQHLHQQQQHHKIQRQMQEQLMQQIQQHQKQLADTPPQLQSQASRESLNSHNSDASKSTKAKRRESSMLSVMGMGGMRRSILPQRSHPPTVGMVSEDSLYD